MFQEVQEVLEVHEAREVQEVQGSSQSSRSSKSSGSKITPYFIISAIPALNSLAGRVKSVLGSINTNLG